jgi:hypothetical protein
MTTYKGINGYAVQSLASDPSPADEGQVWYNNATYTFKYTTLIATTGAWASGGNLNIGRVMTSVTGTKTASVINGGATFPPYWGYQDATENYNGTTWTTSGAPGTARYAPFLVGTQTTALGGAGQDPVGSGYSSTQYYNGATWTSAPSINTARGSAGAGGTQTAAVIFGGAPNTSATEKFNGTSWTTSGAMGTSRYQLQGNNVGLQTASSAIGGYSGGQLTNVENFNGSTWTAGTVLPTANGNQARFGTQTSALSCGGSGATPNTNVIQWNGTSWSSKASFSNGRNTAAGCGTAGTGSSGLLAGSNAGASGAFTEMWAGPGSPVTKTITTS